jgi:hypothetical protein
VEEVPQEVRDDWATHVVDEKTVRNVVLGWVCNGSAPGPSGWTGEMLRTVVLDDECITGFTALINALLSGMFDPFEEARALLLCSHLVMIGKKKADGSDGGARPIAMGEVVWKTAVLCVKRELGERMQDLAGIDVQFGVALPGGSERAVLSIQSALDSDPRNIAVFADISNAFNTRERADIAQELYSNSSAALLFRPFHFSYGCGPSPLLVF